MLLDRDLAILLAAIGLAFALFLALKDGCAWAGPIP